MFCIPVCTYVCTVCIVWIVYVLYVLCVLCVPCVLCVLYILRALYVLHVMCVPCVPLSYSLCNSHLEAGDRIAEVKRTILNDNDKQAGDKQHRSAHSDDPFEEFYKNMDDVEPVNEADEESDPSQRNSHVESRESTPPSLQVITVTRPHECKKGRYLIGVLIAEERLLSMAYAIHATWGNVDGVRLYSTFVIDAMHFPSGVSVTTISTHTEMKLVGMLTTALPLANDTDWLVLAQDTVYIQVEKLEGVLGDMDSAKEVYFGLSSSSSHCSFRSAIVISRTAFVKLSLKLDECSSQFSKLDGDVEGDSILGQCMKSLGITCTIPTQVCMIGVYDRCV